MVIRTDQILHGGNVWLSARKWGFQPEEILDFSANINPLGMPEESKAAILASIERLVHYPEPEARNLKTVLGRYLGMDKENIVLGNGGSELIYLAGRMFYEKRVLLLSPCFSEYGEGIEDACIYRLDLCREEGFSLPLARICDAIQPKDLIFIGNPNNPSGNLFPREDLLVIVQQAQRHQAMVIVDEAFIDFIDDESYSLRDRVHTCPNLIVLGSLTKFFALPGLRIGYALAAKEIVRRMEFLLPPWRINTLAQVAAESALSCEDYIKSTISLIQRERQYLWRQLKSVDGLKPYPGTANYLLVHAGESGFTAPMLQEALGPRGILIRDCSNYHNLDPYYFRVAVRKREENLQLIKALKEILE